MEQNELKLLEDKTKVLINAFQTIKDERNILLRSNEDKTKEISSLQEKISHLESERDEIKNRIEGLISKIDELDVITSDLPDDNEK
jgi:chromosome segregation ATPase